MEPEKTGKGIRREERMEGVTACKENGRYKNNASGHSLNKPMLKKYITVINDDDQWVLFLWNMNGAFSTSHSIKRALPAMSLNSAPGAGDHIKVAVIS